MDITQLLFDWDCPPQYAGYKYLKEFVERIVNDKIQMGKALCIEAAKKFDTSEANIERCLRTLINAWWEKLAEHSVFTQKPTNRELITKCAEYLRSRAAKESKHLAFDSVYDTLLA